MGELVFKDDELLFESDELIMGDGSCSCECSDGGGCAGNTTEADFGYEIIDCEAPWGVAFTDASTPDPAETIVSWAWDFGGDGTSTLQDPTHDFSGTGDYTVELTVTDSAGCTSVKQYLVRIRECKCGAENSCGCISAELPTITVTITGDVGLCTAMAGVHTLTQIGATCEWIKTTGTFPTATSWTVQILCAGEDDVVEVNFNYAQPSRALGLTKDFPHLGAIGAHTETGDCDGLDVTLVEADGGTFSTCFTGASLTVHITA